MKECTTNQGCQSFIVNKNNKTDFVYYWITINKKEFIRRSSGSTFLEISKREIQKIPLHIPIKDEQQKIADCLTALDKKIEAVAQQIHHTEQFKKGLLQKMFV